MLYLSDGEIAKMLIGNMPEVVETIREMFRVLDSGEYVMGGRNGASHGTRISYNNKSGNQRLFIAMPGYLGGKFNCAGIKWHGPNAVVPGNDADSYYMVVLNDAENGRPFAIMQGDTMTRYRTAAVNALAAELLSVPNPETIAIIGPGRVNRLTLDYLLKTMPSINKVKVKGRGHESRDKFISDFKQDFPSVIFSACDKLKDAVVDADIVLINAAIFFDSYADMPIIRASWMKESGTYICSTYVSFPDQVITEDSIKICDLLAMYECYQEELGYPTFKVYGALGNRFEDMIVEGKLNKEDVHDIGEYVIGKLTIDRSLNKPVIFTSGGLTVEDIALGQAMVQKAKKLKVGTEVL